MGGLALFALIISGVILLAHGKISCELLCQRIRVLETTECPCFVFYMTGIFITLHVYGQDLLLLSHLNLEINQPFGSVPLLDAGLQCQ